DGGGWKDVYKVHYEKEFCAAYDQTRDLTMMAQEAIEFELYYRCYVLGRKRVRIMAYDPKSPHHERYVKNAPPMEPAFEERIHRDALALCDGLGYDMNTVEFAVRDGVPYAIDFMNCAPDADRHSVGEENFECMVANMAEGQRQITRLRKEIITLVHESDLRIASAGTHPISHWKDVPITANARYDQIVYELQMLARGNLIFGLHVHVAVEDPETRVQL